MFLKDEENIASFNWLRGETAHKIYNLLRRQFRANGTQEFYGTKWHPDWGFSLYSND